MRNEDEGWFGWVGSYLVNTKTFITNNWRLQSSSGILRLHLVDILGDSHIGTSGPPLA